MANSTPFRRVVPEPQADERLWIGQSSALVRTLMDALPREAQVELAQEFARKILGHDSRPTGVLATIVKLLPKAQAVTVAELKKEISDRGIEAAPKEIYNSIAYLARTGRLRRVGYGRYLVDGAEIATSDDLGGATSRHEDPYRTDPSSET